MKRNVESGERPFVAVGCIPQRGPHTSDIPSGYLSQNSDYVGRIWATMHAFCVFIV